MSYHVDSLIHPPSFLPCNGRDPEPSQPPPGGPHWLHWPSDKAKRHTDELQTLWCSIGLGTKDETVPEVFFLKANVRPAVFRRQFWNITSQEKSLGFLRVETDDLQLLLGFWPCLIDQDSQQSHVHRFPTVRWSWFSACVHLACSKQRGWLEVGICRD